MHGNNRASSHRAVRLSRDKRHAQLLDTARQMVAEEGTDSLTLGRLAARAGVSKPVAYDHFGTRTGLLLELYRWIDTEKVEAFRREMEGRRLNERTTVAELARAYIECASDVTGEFHAVGAALAGSSEQAAIFADLLENSTAMFIAVLRPHVGFPTQELERRSRALVSAGESLAADVVNGRSSRSDAIATFAAIIAGGISAPPI